MSPSACNTTRRDCVVHAELETLRCGTEAHGCKACQSNRLGPKAMSASTCYTTRRDRVLHAELEALRCRTEAHGGKAPVGSSAAGLRL